MSYEFPVNTFAGGYDVVDRCNNQREDSAFTAAAFQEAKFVVFHKLDPIVTAVSRRGPEKVLWLSRSDPLLRALLGVPDAVMVLLGRIRLDADVKHAAADVADDEAALKPGDYLAAISTHASIDIAAYVPAQAEAEAKDWVVPPTSAEGSAGPAAAAAAAAPAPFRKVSELRSFCQRYADSWTASCLAQARSLLEFVRRHKYCGSCGKPTQIFKGGIELKCADQDTCKSACYPRNDPVAIMLVVHGEKALLCRQPKWPTDRFSVVAGFGEHGESLEDMVRREVEEETGVRVARCRYISSQPWPWPYSLMVGFVAEARSDALKIDYNELETAEWFSREEVKTMLDRWAAPSGRRLPPPGAIAHQLCKLFADNHPVTKFD